MSRTTLGQAARNEYRWDEPLEIWCSRRFGKSEQTVGDGLAFAPYEVHRPERFADVPAILVVLTSKSASIHAGFAEALELVRISSNAFKSVLVTDDITSPAVDRCEWPIEHLMSEEEWHNWRQDNWLEHAADTVTRAQKVYGARFVVSPTDLQSANSWVEFLVAIFNIEPAVAREASRILYDNTAPKESSSALRSGWMDLGRLETHRLVFTEAGNRVTLLVRVGATSGVVAASNSEGIGHVLDDALASGWSTVEIDAAGLDSDEPFMRRAILAAADGLSRGGAKILASDQDYMFEFNDFDFRLSASEREGFASLLELRTGMLVHFPPEATTEVLTRVRGVMFV